MRVRFSLAVGGGCLALFLVMPVALDANERQDTLPSEAFLEFLGEWEDAQGNWQDPFADANPEDQSGTQVPVTKVEQNDETH